MAKDHSSSRRDFLKTRAASSALAAAPLGVAAQPTRPFGHREDIGVAAFGMGIIAFYNNDAILQIPGVKLVAACDCYDGRLTRTKEVYGDEVHTTRDYHELLARDDVHAVIINTPDHWHAQMAVDAMRAGKAVHIEKPMVQKIADGRRVIQTQRVTGQVAQVGSEGFRAPAHIKAKELLQSGLIGTLNTVETEVSRNSGIGAWQYTIPPDASPETIDWERFVGPAPMRAFDADRFFCWRKYWDYGTGIPGDMFVHRFSALHFMLDSLGPNRVMATGGIRFWNDGREVPDVITALYDYPATASHPAFTLNARASFADGSGGGPSFRFIGSEGVIEVYNDRVVASHKPRQEPPLAYLVSGYNSVRTFAQAQQDAFSTEYEMYRPEATEAPQASTEEHPVEPANTLVEHFTNFFEAIRNGGPIVQTVEFGLRAAAPGILANHSYLTGSPVEWNPVTLHAREA